jgi:hypothetical protein
MVRPHLDAGRQRQVLDDWCPLYPGYYLYYPSRRQPSAMFALLVEALRYRERGSGRALLSRAWLIGRGQAMPGRERWSRDSRDDG